MVAPGVRRRGEVGRLNPSRRRTVGGMQVRAWIPLRLKSTGAKKGGVFKHTIYVVRSRLQLVGVGGRMIGVTAGAV